MYYINIWNYFLYVIICAVTNYLKEMKHMKKKNGFIIWSVFCCVAIIVMFIFVFSGDLNTNKEETTNLQGIWKITSYTMGESISLAEKEYLIIDEEQAEKYKNNYDEPAIISKYTINEDSIVLKDIGETYKIEKITDNVMRFYMSQSQYFDLIKYESLDLLNMSVDTSILTGKWNVVYRNTAEMIVDEYLIFNDGQMTDYRNGVLTPALDVSYYWEEEHLIVKELGIEMILNIISNDTVILVEEGTGYIWELQKSE